MTKDEMNKSLESGKDLLQWEVLKRVEKCGCSRKSLVNALTKSIPGCDQRPEWMDKPEFDGQTWVELNIASRKYILRLAVNELIARGQLEWRVRERRGIGIKSKLIVPSVLDMLSHL